MREQYISSVKKRLKVLGKRKHEIIVDLNEIFNQAEENGETDEQVIARLGTPEEYAKECIENLPEEVRRTKRIKTRIRSVVVMMIVAVGCVLPYLICKTDQMMQSSSIPADAIGSADEPTSIYLANELGQVPLFAKILLGVSVVLVVLTVVCVVTTIMENHKMKR